MSSAAMRYYHLYREVILYSVSDEQILAAACEGHPVKCLARFRGMPFELREHLSKTLGKIEREHHVFIPEWCAPCQTFLVDTIAAAIEVNLFGQPSLMVGAAGLRQLAARGGRPLQLVKR